MDHINILVKEKLTRVKDPGLPLGLQILWPAIIELFSVVTDELVEFEKISVEVQDFRKITDWFRRIHRISDREV